MSFTDQSEIFFHAQNIHLQHDLEDLEEEFESVIPILPRGKVLELEVISTWGDSNYVGLNGIEFWDHQGQVYFDIETIISKMFFSPYPFHKFQAQILKKILWIQDLL